MQMLLIIIKVLQVCNFAIGIVIVMVLSDAIQEQKNVLELAIGQMDVIPMFVQLQLFGLVIIQAEVWQ